jgi:hypothetical protein
MQELKPPQDFSVILLHDGMVDKTNKPITSSLTLIDLHDIARSCKTYGVKRFFIAHSAPAMRKLARTVKQHWDEGFGATYNPNRTEALSLVRVVSSLDEAIAQIDSETGQLPTLIATSAKDGGDRVRFGQLRTQIQGRPDPVMLMLGTGWGMGPELLARSQFFLEPIKGPTPYNHLSVRSACAILLDKLLGSGC